MIRCTKTHDTISLQSFLRCMSAYTVIHHPEARPSFGHWLDGKCYPYRFPHLFPSLRRIMPPRICLVYSYCVMKSFVTQTKRLLRLLKKMFAGVFWHTVRDVPLLFRIRIGAFKFTPRKLRQIRPNNSISALAACLVKEHLAPLLFASLPVPQTLLPF